MWLHGTYRTVLMIAWRAMRRVCAGVEPSVVPSAVPSGTKCGHIKQIHFPDYSEIILLTFQLTDKPFILQTNS